MASKQLKFGKKALEELPIPSESARAYYRDTQVNGLVLCVTANGAKSFQVYRKLNGRPIRVTLGRFPDMTVEGARSQAQKRLAQIAEGGNPNREKKAKRARSVTLEQVFKDYLAARKSLKPGTVKDYERIMKEAFEDWKKKPMAEITRDMVESQHRKVGKRSEARANNAMRVLRALFNFAKGKYESADGKAIFSDNPVQRISHSKAWYRVERRQTVIKTGNLKAWFKAVQDMKSAHPSEQAETVRDYLLLLLLTGLRREEAARVRWSYVDFKQRTVTIPDTKNREPLVLPLSDYLVAMLQRRSKEVEGDFVFPSKQGKKGYLVAAHKQIEKVREVSGVYFAAHDLRRTFITIAESLDIPAYALKRLLNHKMKHDVTAGYIIMDVERLRGPMQKITDFILKAAEVKKSAEVVKLSKRNNKGALSK